MAKKYLPLIKTKLKNTLEEILGSLKLPVDQIHLEHPAHEEHGDYATNLALILAKTEKKPPDELAKKIVKALEEKGIGQDKLAFLEKVKVAGPGFINFYLSPSFLIFQAQEIAAGKIIYPEHTLGKNQKVMVEYAHPNTHKQFHLGHLRNICLGESLCRILAALGNKVIRTNYQGDVGLHIAKSLYGIKQRETEIAKLKTIAEKIAFLGETYASGTTAYEESEEVKKEIIKLNGQIYDQGPEALPLLKKTRQWSLDYFDAIYQRVDTEFDRLYFESEMVEGKEMAKEAVKKGILEESEGAIVFRGEPYGLDTRVFINSLGFPTYEAKELKLATFEFSEFGEIDRCIHVVGPEQSSFFKVTFKVEELLDAQKYKDKQQHLSYGYVQLKRGKMSSRQGTVVEANWLLDEVKSAIRKSFDCSDEAAEAIAVGAVKYSMLKVGRQNDFLFDIYESIALEGDSGPYLQYTYARSQAVLAKAEPEDLKFDTQSLAGLNLQPEELAILRFLYRFPEVVHEAGQAFSPNLICGYLHDLAQRYNLFYQRLPILKSKDPQKGLRLTLTQATGQVIKQGLALLGIQVLARM